MTAPERQSLILDHKWRPPVVGWKSPVRSLPVDDRPCGYMSCSRPRDEHEHSVTLKDVW